MVPSQQPRKPSGIEMIPGFSRLTGEPCPSGPGHTVGLRTISPIELMTPNSTPVTAPAVLNRFQVSASSNAGKLADAATAKARPTMNETFRPAPPRMATPMATAPMANAAILATQTSSRSESRPLRRMFDQTSWANAPEAEITSPATTARIVAKATAATMARTRSPPVVPAPPPSSWARTGTARLPPLPAAASPGVPRIARAPRPRTTVTR